ncbi:S46 family peptidase [Anaerophaga thermohalophila]|uniref:S46 family peptidase n=1 Tax=Anaerophaga thermohalophila TaxID=177400 RepID=UPI0003670503|nr:S46 family peptidase [Anaerophaga thermohalophila]
MWKRALLLTLLNTFFFITLLADEGMWLPWHLPQSQIEKMHEMGLELPEDEIFSTSENSLNFSIVSLDDGSCTGSFVSNKGLLLTNHHCAYGDIQQHSSVDNNLLSNGFWAQSPASEIPNPGKTATILIDAKNLTPVFNSALKNVSGLPETEFIIDSISKVILDTVSLAKGQDAEIKDFLFQNQFFLLTTQTFRDVRLVAAPPEDIAQFGGERDNWMWPRHSADFAFYRVYCSPEGEPADYHPDNVPFKPKRFLTISKQGVEEGDFTMTLGYPGETNRYITAAGMKESYDIINPVIADVRKIKQAIWKENMKNSKVEGIRYADKYANSANFQKYAKGQNESIKELDLIDSREELENNLQNRINDDKKFREILTSSRILYLMRKNLTKTTIVTIESLINGPEISSLIIEAFNLYGLLKEDHIPQTILTNELEKLKKSGDNFFEDFSAAIDKEVFEEMLTYYLQNLNDSLRISDEKLFKNATNIRDLSDKIYSGSLFADSEKFKDFIAAPSSEKLVSDPGFGFYYDLFQEFGPVYAMYIRIDDQINYSMHRYLSILMKSDSIDGLYPDANSTLRLSFGKIVPYSPEDGITYASFSTFRGMKEKINSGKTAYQTKTDVQLLFDSDDNAYGKNLPLCFISDNDISGGNSGSPVLNNRGEIVGLAFDGNWEGMASDISYSSDLQRCISVDIRYILFLIDKFAGEHYLSEELKITAG